MPRDSLKKLSRSVGLTLIELMIALTIGLLLLAGMTQFFLSNSMAFRFQQDQNKIQENARFALRMLESELRMVDHWVGISPDKIDTSKISKKNFFTAKNDCSTEWLKDIQNSLVAFDGAKGLKDSGVPEGCITEQNHRDNSDILLVRRAGHGRIDPTPENLKGSDVFFQLDVGDAGQLLPGSAISKSPSDINKDGRFFYPYEAKMYYVRECRIPDSSGNCSDKSDGGEPIPTLVSATLVGTELVEERVLEGVEQMQMLFLLESGTGAQQCWLTADLVADGLSNCGVSGTGLGNGWDLVSAVRIALLVRSDESLSSVRDEGYHPILEYKYNLPEGRARKYRRLKVDKVVQLRNRVRG